MFCRQSASNSDCSTIFANSLNSWRSGLKHSSAIVNKQFSATSAVVGPAGCLRYRQLLPLLTVTTTAVPWCNIRGKPPLQRRVPEDCA